MLFDHVGFPVRDLQASKGFYSAALAPLDVTVIVEFEGWAGLGRKGNPAFWIYEGEDPPPESPIHVAFAARDREQVRAFHAAALAAGGRDNGPPGLRPEYHAHYYGAFVLDPDGNNIEAVCHLPEE